MKYIGADVLKLMANAKLYNSYIVKLCLKKINFPENILDFGAGSGTVAKLLREKGVQVTCVECDEDLKNELLSIGFEAYENLDFIKDESVKNIVSFNVLEHIEDDRSALENLYKKLCYGGLFFLFLPAYSDLYSKFDEKLGHFRRYDKDSLIKLLEECGFKIKEIEYFDSIGYFCAKLYKYINRSGNLSKISIILFDRLLFPISVLLDKLFKYKFGKNIALVLTKEND